MEHFKTPDGITIVEYNDNLAPALAEFWNESNESWGDSGSVTTAAQVISKHASSSDLNSYVAMDKDRAVGYCSLGHYWADADALYIPLLNVSPAYQGNKIGKALVLTVVNRTIELGFPRIDIHTWPGNTEAVPLYKKCGYLWEDRSNSTHLVNFIPQILKHKLFEDFFKKADWYNDSTRKIEIVPDGVKENKFEIFGYSWEKDSELLCIGYERTGRQIRLIETNDYKIELMAEEHELAYGLDYNCKFTVENKSGKELHIKITGTNDKNITFDYSLDTKVTGCEEFTGSFYVGEVDEPQSTWLVHPCLMANVEINCGPVTLGLGINPKFPLTVDLSDHCKIKQTGLELEAFINIRSSLQQDATVNFAVPNNKLLGGLANFTVNIPAKGKSSIPVKPAVIGLGYEAIPISYDIALDSGKRITFNRPLHVSMQGLTHIYSGETDDGHFIVNGPWTLRFDKAAHDMCLSNRLVGYGDTWIEPPKLGKPFDDEFVQIKPTITAYVQGTDAVIEVEYTSKKFEGLVLTEILSLSQGILARKYRVKNTAATPQTIMVLDTGKFPRDDNSIFKYNGQFTQNFDNPRPGMYHFGMGNTTDDYVEENWVFQASPTSPRGMTWPIECRVNVDWYTSTEFNIGELKPGESTETKPITCVYGLFSNYNDFRNYAMKLFDRTDRVPVKPVEVKLNNYNPIISEDVNVEVLYNRDVDWDGEISVSSVNNLFETVAKTEDFRFTIKPDKKLDIDLVRVQTNFSHYENHYDRAVFFPSGKITAEVRDNVYMVSNGKITFKVDPKFGQVCYSLTDEKGQEWFTHQYPERKPFAWWNPFLGGARLLPPDMNNTSVLKESIKADFTEIHDNHGNLWQGICSTVTINEEDEIKGGVYETYYVTQPGLPVLCVFYRVINNTGVYRSDTMEFDFFVNPADNAKDVVVEFNDKNRREYRLRLGTYDNDGYFENVAKFSSSTRNENMYVFHGNKNNGKTNFLNGDNKNPAFVEVWMETITAPSGVFTSSPVLFMLTEQDLPREAFDELERLEF